jgi:Leucine-rich repeat (LRR) protein
MTTVRALAQWATKARKQNGGLAVWLRRDLDPNGLHDLLDTVDLSRVRGLHIPGSIGLPGLRNLLSSSALPRLVSVALVGFEDPDDAVDVLFESPILSRLRVLKVWGVSDAITARLGRGQIKQLQQLDIRNSPELTGLDRFFESPMIDSLHFLSIERTGLSDATMLFHNPAVSNLRTLSLAACEFDSETVDHLFASPYLKNLRKLNLSHNSRDDVQISISRMMQSGRLQTLERLFLCGCDVSELDWERVHFPNLRTLDLRDCWLGFDELLEVLEAPGLPVLDRLVANIPEEPLPAKLDRRLVLSDRKLPWA